MLLEHAISCFRSNLRLGSDFLFDITDAHLSIMGKT